MTSYSVIFRVKVEVNVKVKAHETWEGKMYKSKNRVDKKVRYGKIKIYFLIFFLLSTIIFIILFKTNFFEINGIFVNSNTVVSDDEIVSYSGIKTGDNIFKIKLSEAREKLIKNPLIKDVTIKRKLPNKLIINVIERKKLAAVSYMGIYFVIDEEGVILYTAQAVEDMYVIEGFEFESFLKGEKIKVKNEEDLRKIIELCSLLENSDLAIIPKISYENENIILYIDEDFKIKFGRGENLSKRFVIFKAIYYDLISKNIDSGSVDISHDGYPTYSPFGE
ncbi:cell division protein FtsQ [Maledivibacter halophilus]|uniref:Cell division protein FtsQ n=2 Tax=Maledivibacter halophilus TaxID=36842 RepID=A0A1T5LSC0_9FIRM|nr:cell division protein FtsQ [Maledivibacter halophilus]